MRGPSLNTPIPAWRRRLEAILIDPVQPLGRARTLHARTVSVVLLFTVLLGIGRLIRISVVGDFNPRFVQSMWLIALINLVLYLVARIGWLYIALFAWLVWLPFSFMPPLLAAPTPEMVSLIYLVSMAHLILGPGLAGLVLNRRWALLVSASYLAIPCGVASVLGLRFEYPIGATSLLVLALALLALHHQALRASERLSETRRKERDVAARRGQRTSEELEHTSARLSRRTRALEAANRELAAFSHATAHELRGPTRTVAGFAELLRQDVGPQLDDEPADHLGRIERAADHLSLILDGMQAHVDLGTRFPHNTTVDVRPIIERVLSNCVLPEGLELEFEPGSPVIETDELLLETALQQLLHHLLTRDPDSLRRLHIVARPVADGCSIVLDPRGPIRTPQPATPRHQTNPFHQLVPSAQGMGLVSARKALSRLGGALLPLADRGAGPGYRMELPPSAPLDPADTFVG
jgi:signal transduction histidine kinase